MLKAYTIHNLVDFADRGDTSQSGIEIQLVRDGNDVYPATLFSSVNSHITFPETSTATNIFKEATFKRDKWTHLAVVYDFHGKSVTVYVGGKKKETRRYVRTFK